MANTMPSAPEAEASLLGTVLVYQNAARTAVEEGLTEDDFYGAANKRIFHAVVELYKDGSPVDLTTVATRLKDAGALDAVGGLDYLTQLSEAAVTSANTKNYISIIRDKAVMRAMIETADRIRTDGLGNVTDVDTFLDDAEREILSVSRNRRTGEFRSTPDLVTGVMDQIQKMSDSKTDLTGIKTGFTDLDHTTHGLQRGDLIILAARPAMGKTAVSLNLALNVAQLQKKSAVAVFSLEMSAEQLIMRLLSAKSRVEGDKIKTGRLSNDEWSAVSEAAAGLKGTNLFIDDTPGIKVAEIFGKCRKLQAEMGSLSLVVVDYIQLITGSGSRMAENRQQEVSEISRSLKALARELKVPVVALSQLSRSVESREDKRPLLSDLRESGALEQDADIVIMLYRDAYYKEELREASSQSGQEDLELNIAKHRNGAVRKITMKFEPATNCILNIAWDGQQH